MKILAKIKTPLLFALLFLLIIQTVGAATIPQDFRPINEPFNLKYDREGGAAIIILQIIAGGLLYFAAPVGVIMIGLGGWELVTGGADSEKVEQGKKHLLWSIVGLFVIILSYSIVRFLISFAIDSASPPPASPTTTEEPVSEPIPEV